MKKSLTPKEEIEHGQASLGISTYGSHAANKGLYTLPAATDKTVPLARCHMMEHTYRVKQEKISPHKTVSWTQAVKIPRPKQEVI